MNGLLGFRYVLAGNRAYRALFLRDIAAGSNRALKVIPQLVEKVIHVIGLIVFLQALGIFPLLQQHDLIGIGVAFKLLIAQTAVL